MGLEPWMDYILGLRLTPDSEQWRESDRFLAACRRRGLVAERLCGRADLLFDEWPAAQPEAAAVSTALEDAAGVQFEF
jgi:hypothetical protein